MHRVLKDTGSIYLQCDYRIVHYLKVEMDKIFGINNFRNDIKWRYSVNYKQNTYPHDTDNILFYTKSDKFTYHQQYRDSEATMKRLKDVLTEKNGKLYYYQGRFLKDSPYKFKLRSEQWVKENNVEEYFFEKEYAGFRVSEMWDDISYVSRGKERVGYDTQKPLALMERILLSSSNGNDVVADFFCGSGGFIVKAKELNRNFLGCDLNHKAIEITNERLKLN